MKDAAAQPPSHPVQERVRDLVTARAERDALDEEEVTARLRQVYDEFMALRMHYQFGIDEVQTKVEILRKEFEQMHDYSPIEHVRTRLKSVESLMEKALRTEGDMTVRAIRARIHDIAGVRITCSFVADAYWVADMLASQQDLEVLQVKDYIANPKPNGYRSLHLIVQVPVYLSTHVEHVPVELQIRTIAMDFWASTEHKLAYKYEKNLPPELRAELDEAARVADELDRRMERLRGEIRPQPAPGRSSGLFPGRPGPAGPEGQDGAASADGAAADGTADGAGAAPAS
ncbi:GTP pyrophosphokinase [Brachybacterium aquaticum]|uniref:Putative GTP pyrophosphokinase n=1 Tax=Brachybacterium aquaticum TaxID=1432564 RepID=A0A841AD10_9MICO|nr:GTP pyrophosphokinase family protein [Brachybacterium aquaticum]MBB5831044.1 putative GTP pyrophosphokinase [Brachybacterium aquaticum]